MVVAAQPLHSSFTLRPGQPGEETQLRFINSSSKSPNTNRFPHRTVSGGSSFELDRRKQHQYVGKQIPSLRTRYYPSYYHHHHHQQQQQNYNCFHHISPSAPGSGSSMIDTSHHNHNHHRSLKRPRSHSDEGEDQPSSNHVTDLPSQEQSDPATSFHRKTTVDAPRRVSQEYHNPTMKPNSMNLSKRARPEPIESYSSKSNPPTSRRGQGSSKATTTPQHANPTAVRCLGMVEDKDKNKNTSKLPNRVLATTTTTTTAPSSNRQVQPVTLPLRRRWHPFERHHMMMMSTKTTASSTAAAATNTLPSAFEPPSDPDYWKQRCFHWQEICQRTRQKVRDLEEDQRQLRRRLALLEEQVVLCPVSVPPPTTQKQTTTTTTVAAQALPPPPLPVSFSSKETTQRLLKTPPNVVVANTSLTTTTAMQGPPLISPSSGSNNNMMHPDNVPQLQEKQQQHEKQEEEDRELDTLDADKRPPTWIYIPSIKNSPNHSYGQRLPCPFYFTDGEGLSDEEEDSYHHAWWYHDHYHHHDDDDDCCDYEEDSSHECNDDDDGKEPK